MAAVSASQPGLAVVVAWASAALSAALTVFLLCAIPTLVVSCWGFHRDFS